MNIYMKGAVAHLHGDLTYTGVTHTSIDSLTVSLQQIEFGGDKHIRVDCGSLRSADISGLQLLYVWIQCARFRGVEPELVNLPESLQQAMHTMELSHCFPVVVPSLRPATESIGGLGKIIFQ